MQLHRFVHYSAVQLILVILLTLYGVAFANADTNKFRIVTDIAPIHSLVSMVVGPKTDVQLLVPPSQSPHSFSLKPSQIRIINQATLIVTLSDSFTPALSRHLKSIDEKVVLLQLTQTNGEYQNNKHSEFEHADNEFDSDGHSENVTDHDKADLTSAPSEHLHDPHTWLNPENAILWLDRIASTAIGLDEKNSAVYESNVKRAKADLTIMHRELAEHLTQVKSAPYIVYHDAYQHFAQSYGLQKPTAIALSDARAPGARKLRAMRAEAKQSKCVFSEILHDDIIVDTVTSGLSVNRAILDPMGSTLPIGPDHYPQLMRALVNNFVACLT